MLLKLPHYKGNIPKTNSFYLHSMEERRIIIPSLLGGLGYSIYRQLIRTGLEAKIPEGKGLFIQGIPGACHSKGIMLPNPIILTSKNFGEIKVILCNIGAKEFTVYPGDKIAEAIIINLGGEDEKSI